MNTTASRHASSGHNDCAHNSANTCHTPAPAGRLSGGLPRTDPWLADDKDAPDRARVARCPAIDAVWPGACQHHRQSSVQQ